jgi:tubulin polyglutamylase TTLL6/13
LGYEEASTEEDSWVILWSDGTAPLERILSLKHWQRCNHFPGMSEISRKDTLGKNFNRLSKLFPDDYNFHPRTFLLPTDYGELRAVFQKREKRTTYIVKPDASSQGKGIYLTRSLDEIDPMANIIVQEYMQKVRTVIKYASNYYFKPYLIDDTKFDLRIYVLVTGCDPLRIYLYKDGLARFATEKYVTPNATNLDRAFMHLTNYSINKMNNNFIPEGPQGSKRPLSTVWDHLRSQGYDPDIVWTDIAVSRHLLFW